MPYSPIDFINSNTDLDELTLDHLQQGVIDAERVEYKGAVNGYAALDATGKVPAAQLPAAASSAIPGEIRMWSGSALPNLTKYGKWVWADGTAYAAATYPEASANIHANWKTHAGKADPGAGMFRVPDMRGATPVGMDAMPGGASANRIVRTAADTLAGILGEETHALTQAELASHAHVVTDPGHNHGISDPGHNHPSGYGALVTASPPDGQSVLVGNAPGTVSTISYTGIGIQTRVTGITVQNTGNNNAHENLPPSNFIPYIVKLDG